MTKREAAVLQAYTGFKMLEGFDQEYAEQYINELLGDIVVQLSRHKFNLFIMNRYM